MSRTTLPAVAFAGALLLHVAQALHYYPLLPARVASHFDASGAPNAWASKEFFVGLSLGAAALVAVAFLVSAFAPRFVPNEKINLPNKDYWLAPQRRAETLDWLSAHFLLLGAATILLFFDVFGQTFRMNVGLTAGLDHPFRSLAVYAAFTAAWIAVMLRRFSRPG